MDGNQPTDQTGKEAAKEPALPLVFPWKDVKPKSSSLKATPNSSGYPDHARQNLVLQQYQNNLRDHTRAQLAFIASTKVTHSKGDSRRAWNVLTGKQDTVQQHEEAARAPNYDSDETITDDEFISQTPAIVRGVHAIPVDPVLLEHDRQAGMKESKKFGPPLVPRTGPVNKTREAMREYLAQKPKRNQTLPVQANPTPFVLPFHSKTTGSNTFLPNPIFDGRVKSSETGQIEPQSFQVSIQHPQPLRPLIQSTPPAIRALFHGEYVADMSDPLSPEGPSYEPSWIIPEEEMISTTAEAPVEDMYEEFVKEFNYSPTEHLDSSEEKTVDSFEGKTYEQVFDEFIQYPPYEDAVHQENEAFLRSLDDLEDRDILKDPKPLVDQKNDPKTVVAQEKNLGVEKAGMVVVDGNDSTPTGQPMEAVKAVEVTKAVEAAKAMKASAVPIEGTVDKPVEDSVEYSGMKSWAPPKNAKGVVPGDRRYYVIPDHHVIPGRPWKTVDGPSSSAPIWKPNADRSVTLAPEPVVDPKLQEDIRLGSGYGSGAGSASASGSSSVLPPGYGHYVDGTIRKNTRTEQILDIRDFEAENMVLDEDEVENMSDGELDALVLFPELHKKYGAKKNKGKGKGRA